MLFPHYPMEELDKTDGTMVTVIAGFGGIGPAEEAALLSQSASCSVCFKAVGLTDEGWVPVWWSNISALFFCEDCAEEAGEAIL